VAGTARRALQAVGCTPWPWHPLVSAALPVAFAWQVRRWALRAVGCNYALASLGLRRSAGGFCVAGAALAAVQGVALASLGLRCSAGGFCVAGAALGADPAAETVETWKKAAKLSFQHRTHRLFP